MSFGILEILALLPVIGFVWFLVMALKSKNWLNNVYDEFWIFAGSLAVFLLAALGDVYSGSVVESVTVLPAIFTSNNIFAFLL